LLGFVAVGCARFGPLIEEEYSGLGRFVHRLAERDLTGVVVAAPYGQSEPSAVRMAAATSGLSFAEAAALKDLFATLRDQVATGDTPKLEMAIEPENEIVWRGTGVKHHGALLVAEKGLSLRVPQMAQSPSAEGVYTEILSRWVEGAVKLLTGEKENLSTARVTTTHWGRFEVIASRKGIAGAVIGAPHGSYDARTSWVARRLSQATGFAAVIAKGFTPTETGGTRINVNRPTERATRSGASEIHTERAAEIYRVFKSLVLEGSAAPIEFYVDIHHYTGGDKIQVATVGLTAAEAGLVKKLYLRIRDHQISGEPDLRGAELWIEPLDRLDLTARGAKAEGILTLARTALHIELPSRIVFASARSREVYTEILARLLAEIAPLLMQRRE
jgi:hypothetical protein